MYDDRVSLTCFKIMGSGSNYLMVAPEQRHVGITASAVFHAPVLLDAAGVRALITALQLTLEDVEKQKEEHR